MKFLLLFISLTYISWAPMSDPPDNSRQVEDKIGVMGYKIFPVDIAEVVKEKNEDLNSVESNTAIEEIPVNACSAESKNLGEMENPCLNGCVELTANCACGGSVTYQWCPCPWFPPDPILAGYAYCEAFCNQQ